MNRTVNIILDEDASTHEGKYRSASSILDALSPKQVVALRYNIHRLYKSCNPKYKCAVCGTPLYLCSGSTSGFNRSGKDAFFSHHDSKRYPDANDCPYYTSSQSPDGVYASKFAGRQEGELHQNMKIALAEHLVQDNHFSNINIERRVVNNIGEYRIPDVSAELGSTRVALEVQLATTILTTINDRTAFFQRARIPCMWLTAVGKSSDLNKQAFRDLYLANEGQIFGINEQTLRLSRETQELHLLLYTIHPRIENSCISQVWAETIVSNSKINWETGNLQPRVPSLEYGIVLKERLDPIIGDQKKKLFSAVRKGRVDVARASWNTIARLVGGAIWNDAGQQHWRVKMLGVFATAATGEKRDASKYRDREFSQIFNNFLEDKQCRFLTRELTRIASAYGNKELLCAAKSTCIKIERNSSENDGTDASALGPMLDALFPASALSRLGKVPEKIVSVTH